MVSIRKAKKRAQRRMSKDMVFVVADSWGGFKILTVFQRGRALSVRLSSRWAQCLAQSLIHRGR
ncbi:hypothetical protein [Caldimonas tepidiphila]|uniref:hypothetical protein n=1 Tax=Caldimonas tepidiphila TaxID=2315841 RepID=UPI000E5A39FC|nr:hypothetical protein [Caldimonas tepidiphila]